MYINYYELRSFVYKIFDKYLQNDLKSIFEMLDKCIFIDKIVDSIIIKHDNDNYNLNFTDKYLGTMKSDLYYNINSSKTKLNILKYLFSIDYNSLLIFLASLLNINVYKLSNDNNACLTINSVMKKKDDKIIDVGNNICSFECITENQVYNDSVLIGEYRYIGPFYIHKNKSYKNSYIDRSIKTNDKLSLINELYNYNNNCFKCNLLNRINTSEKLIK